MSRKHRAPTPVPNAALESGLIVGSHGRHCVVESADGSRRICHPRGKKNQAVVGDQVLWLPAPPGQGEEGSIEQVQPRRNLLYRQDEIRTKSFAANIDQVLILIAAEPVFSESQLARALIAAEDAGIAPIVALNKSDLAQPFAQAWERLAAYRAILDGTGQPHYRVLGLNLARPGAEQAALLRDVLADKATLVLGPSGSGKSTLINLLIPQAQAATGEISQALNSGRHTTTTTTWYWLDAARRTALIDSPGFQEFGLRHIAPTALAHHMPDIGQHAQGCKFYNCTHLHEPGCAVLAEVGHSISAQRHRLYADFFQELAAPAIY